MVFSPLSAESSCALLDKSIVIVLFVNICIFLIVSYYYMNKAKRKGRVFIIRIIVVLLLFFATLSLLTIQKSYFAYKKTKEREAGALFEKAYVEKQLENARTHLLKKQYAVEHASQDEQRERSRIDVRGTDFSVKNKDKPFSGTEFKFEVLPLR